MARTVVDALRGLLGRAKLAELPLKIITARSAVRAGWKYGELRGLPPSVMPVRPLLVRASCIADVTWLPSDTTHIFAVGRDAACIYCIADSNARTGGPVVRVLDTLYAVTLLDEDAWIRNDPPQPAPQREGLDDMFRHAYWWDDSSS